MTGADGMFALSGVADGALELRVEADGYARTVLRPVRSTEIQSVELRPTGFVEGRIETKPGAGEPAFAGGVRLLYEWYENSPYYPVQQDGAFRIPIPFAGRFAVAAQSDSLGLGISGVLGGPARSVFVQLAAEEDCLRVRARDRVTRASVRDFQGCVTFALGQSLDRLGHVERGLSHSAEDGVLRLQRWDARQRPEGSDLLVLAAPGYRTTVVKDPQAGGDGVLTVDLDPRPVVAGRVEGPDGAPRAGVPVTLRRASPYVFPYLLRDVTDKQGRFAFREVLPGAVVIEALGDHAQRTVELDPSAAPSEVILRLLPRYTLRGRAEHAPPGARLQIVSTADVDGLLRARAFAGVAGLAAPAGSIPVAADGTFMLEAAERPPLSMLLWLPSAERRGPALTTVVRELSKTDLESPIVLDLDAQGPGRIVAELARKGPWLSRLAVLSTRHAVLQRGRLDDALPHVRWCEAGDGRFDFTVLPGRHKLELIDLGTCVRVWSSGEFDVRPGQTSPVRIDAELACLEPRVRGPGGGPAAAEWMQVHVGEAARKGSAGSYMPVQGAGYLLTPLPPGVDLLGRFGTITFVVPVGPVRLCSCAGFNSLSCTGKSGGGSPTVLDELFEVLPGKDVTSVELELRQAWPCRVQ